MEPIGTHREQSNQHPIKRLPHLQTGDHLSRPEFERRYAAMPHTRAELIEGVVYMASPLYVSHGIPHARIIGWLMTYCAYTPDVELCDNTSLRLDMHNEVQPDAMMFFTHAGGRSRMSSEGYVEGSPELIVEIASSSAAYDMYEKRVIYQRCGVQEYIIWLVSEQRIVWLTLRDGVYEEVRPDGEGIIRSGIFPGLDLDVPAMVRGELARVLALVQGAISSSE
jgi:Uma2 family endonuclease